MYTRGSVLSNGNKAGRACAVSLRSPPQRFLYERVRREWPRRHVASQPPTAAKRSEPRGPHAGAASKCVRRHDRLVCHSVPLIFSIQDWTIDTALGFCCFGHCDCTSSSYSVVYTSPMTSHAIVSSLTTVALNV